MFSINRAIQSVIDEVFLRWNIDVKINSICELNEYIGPFLTHAYFRLAPETPQCLIYFRFQHDTMLRKHWSGCLFLISNCLFFVLMKSRFPLTWFSRSRISWSSLSMSFFIIFSKYVIFISGDTWKYTNKEFTYT